jgi:hypothetical protein
MQTHRRAVLALGFAAGLLLAGCDDHPRGADGNDTSVLGSAGGQRGPAAPGLTDARGREIPQPPLPPNTSARIAATGEENALAVWVQDGTLTASSYAPTAGWSAPQPLEEMHGDASDPELAANAQGKGLAVWRHTVGAIESLRFSLYTPGAGWSIPDVMPGALPRPRGAGGPIELRLDDAGNATARWPSGFDARQSQQARYTEGQGWSRAVDEPLAAASR